MSGASGTTEPESRPRLHGERLVLRALRPDDRERLEQILREPEVSRWWVVYDSDAEKVVDELYVEPDGVAYVIELGRELIGLIQYAEEDTPGYPHAGIDLVVATAWQGQGLGVEAIRVLARHLFEERGHHRLTIDPAAANARAIRAYERVGFRRVGVMREYARGPDGTWRDGLLMDLLTRDFTAQTQDRT
jgi:aminoglycoside 6'-N-acetyltransferase